MYRGAALAINECCHAHHIHWTLKKCNDPFISVLCQGQKNASSDLCSVFLLSCQRLNFHGFVLVVKICLNLSVPYIFIYKDVNIFISGGSVGSIGNGIDFFLYCIKIYCWMVYIFLFLLSGF